MAFIERIFKFREKEQEMLQGMGRDSLMECITQEEQQPEKKGSFRELQDVATVILWKAAAKGHTRIARLVFGMGANPERDREVAVFLAYENDHFNTGSTLEDLGRPPEPFEPPGPNVF